MNTLSTLKAKSDTAIKLKLRLWQALGMHDKVRRYIRYNGLGKRYLS